MLRNLSSQNLSGQIRQKAAITGRLTKNLVISASDFSTYFSLFLNNSKARDKFLAMFQYYFDFTCTCAQYSSIEAIRKRYHDVKSILIQYNVKESISSARKVFRLLRFLDEVKGMSRILRTSKPMPFKVISILTYSFSFMYYLSDNFLWFISVLTTSKAVDPNLEKRIKDRKNLFSLLRIIFYLIILVYSMVLRTAKHRRFDEELAKDLREDCGTEHRQYYFRKMIKGRRKLRFLVLETVLSVMRFLMLVKSLKLPGYNYFDPIFVSICGLISAGLGLFKVLYEKKIVIKMKNKHDEEDKPKAASRAASVRDM